MFIVELKNKKAVSIFIPTPATLLDRSNLHILAILDDDVRLVLFAAKSVQKIPILFIIRTSISNSAVASLPAYMRIAFLPPAFVTLVSIQKAQSRSSTEIELTVVSQEVGDVVGVALDHDPAILVGLVLGHFSHGNLLGHFLLIYLQSR